MPEISRQEYSIGSGVSIAGEGDDWREGTKLLAQPYHI